MPVNDWNEVIDITPWTRKYKGIDDRTERGMLQFREVRDGVVSELKRLSGYRNRDQLDAMTREDRASFLELHYFVKDIEESRSVMDYQFHMSYVYA